MPSHVCDMNLLFELNDSVKLQIDVSSKLALGHLRVLRVQGLMMTCDRRKLMKVAQNDGTKASKRCGHQL